MKEHIKQLRDSISTHLKDKEFIDMGIGNAALFQSTKSYESKPKLYHPHIMLLAQGKKIIYLGGKEYLYDPYHYFVQTVSLPLNCKAVIEDDQPIMGIILRITPQVIGEILFEMETEPVPAKSISSSLYNAKTTDKLIDSCIRLVNTLESKNETKVLGPCYVKEILFRILNGENGNILRELANNNRGFYQIARVINNIHENYSQPIVIPALAKEAGMSPTAFHSAFKSVTSISPLQYIKNIRLHKAKEFIQNEGEKVNTAATRVGYESTSQFSREYKRFFGTSPTSDRLSGSSTMF